MFRKLTNRLHLTHDKQELKEQEHQNSQQDVPKRSRLRTFFAPVRHFFAGKRVRTPLAITASAGSEVDDENISIRTRGELQLDESLVLERWVAVCASSFLLPPFGRMNQLFCPIPTALAFLSMSTSHSSRQRDFVNSVFLLDDVVVENLKRRLQPRIKASTKECYLFYKMIVDDDDSALVKKKYMEELKSTAHEDIILSCRQSRIERYLQMLSGGMVSGPRNALKQTTAYCSAGLKAYWNGQASDSLPAVFATTYSHRQRHLYFELRDNVKIVRLPELEAFSLKLKTSKGNYSVTLIRPIFMGALLEMRNNLTGEILADIKQRLRIQKPVPQKMLLPKFSFRLKEDISHMWRIKGIVPNSSNFPPIDGIWHSVVFSFDENGIGMQHTPRENKPLKTSLKQYANLQEKHYQTFSARFDKPFMFIVNSDDCDQPIIAGTYMGSPQPSLNQVLIPIPEDIQAKGSPKILYTKKKPSKKHRKRSKKNKTSSEDFSSTN